jgi:hypothetical protein
MFLSPDPKTGRKPLSEQHLHHWMYEAPLYPTAARGDEALPIWSHSSWTLEAWERRAGVGAAMIGDWKYDAWHHPEARIVAVKEGSDRVSLSPNLALVLALVEARTHIGYCVVVNNPELEPRWRLVEERITGTTERLVREMREAAQQLLAL